MTGVVQKPSHLDWIELSFERGMWTIGDWLIPEGGAQLLKDCYPQPGLGLRAAPVFDEWPTTGLNDAANEFPIGLYVQSGIPERAGGTDNSIIYLATRNQSTGVTRLYQWDLTQTTDPTAWTQIKAFTALSTAVGSIFFAEYTLTVAPVGTHVYCSVRGCGGTDDGVWRIQYTTGAAPANSTVTQVEAIVNPGPLVAHQDRLVVSVEPGIVRWNDPGTEAGFNSTNELPVLPYLRGTENAFLKSWVTDLLIGKVGAPFVLLSGDITDPYTRTLLDANHAVVEQIVAECNEGIVYQAFRDGVYITRDGASAEKISAQLAPDTISPESLREGIGSPVLGHVLAVGDMIYTPTGHVYDRRTRAWHVLSQMNDELLDDRPVKWMQYAPLVDQQNVWFVSEGLGFKILYGRPFETATNRSQMMTAVSAPMRHPSGRQIRVRKVQPFVRVYEDGATVTVTVNGVSRSVTDVPAGRKQLTFPFLEAEDVLDLSITTDSGQVGVEAPSVETVRVGIQAGHLHAPEVTS